jgi:hypothetical protein
MEKHRTVIITPAELATPLHGQNSRDGDAGYLASLLPYRCTQPR